MFQHSTEAPPLDYPLDHVHRMRDWCRLVGIDMSTAWRWERAGKAPVITRLGTRYKGVRHRNHLAWLAAREQKGQT